MLRHHKPKSPEQPEWKDFCKHKKSCIHCFIAHWLESVWDYEVVTEEGKPWTNMEYQWDYEKKALETINAIFKESAQLYVATDAKDY